MSLRIERLARIAACLLTAWLLITASSPPSSADEGRPPFSSPQAFHEWLAGTTWQNENNKTIRTFEKDVMIRGAGGRGVPYRILDAKRVEVELRNTLQFTFDDDYQAYTSSYRNQRFVFVERRESTQPAADSSWAPVDDVATVPHSPDSTEPLAPQASKQLEDKPSRKWRDQLAAENDKTMSPSKNGWLAWVVASLSGIGLAMTGSLIDIRRRPGAPHELFSELDVTADTISIRSPQLPAVIYIAALFGGIGAGFLTNAVLAAESGSGVFWGIFAFVFLLIGLFGTAGRSSTALDKPSNVASRTFSVLGIPLSTTRLSLDDLSHVEVQQHTSEATTDEDGSTSTPVTTYTVCLPYGPDDRELNLTSSSEFDEARARGKLFAKFLEINLHDATRRAAVVHSPDQLDQSFCERIRSAGGDLRKPEPPEGCRIRCETNGNSVTLTLPGKLEAAELMQEYGPNGVLPDVERLPAPLRGLLAFAQAASSILPDDEDTVEIGAKPEKQPHDEQVQAGPDGIVITIRDDHGQSNESMPADEIEQLEIVFPEAIDSLADETEARLRQEHGDAVDTETLEQHLAQYRSIRQRYEAAPKLHHDWLVARSDHQSLEFGRGLTRCEAQWMHDLLRMSCATSRFERRWSRCVGMSKRCELSTTTVVRRRKAIRCQKEPPTARRTAKSRDLTLA